MKINKKLPTWVKFQVLFQNMVISRPEFFLNPLMEIRHTLGLPKLKIINSAATQLRNTDSKEEKDINYYLSWLRKARIDFFSKTGDEVKELTYSMVREVIRNNNLGHEWTIPLTDLVITGVFIPPFYNFSIQPGYDTSEISITINSTTTKADLAEGWKMIKHVQSNLKPTKYPLKATLKSIRDSVEQAKLVSLKQKHNQIRYLDFVGRMYPDTEDDKSTSAMEDKKIADRIRKSFSRHK